MNNDVTYNDLILKGKTITSIRTGEIDSNDAIEFTDSEGIVYFMYHSQDCCESVGIESVVGNFDDLIGHPLLLAEEASSSSENDYGSSTWTFYRFATIKGRVDVRWYGSSNGYYSESVYLSVNNNPNYEVFTEKTLDYGS